MCPKADKLILEFTWKGRGTRITKTIFKKRDKFERLSLPNFRTFSTVVTKTTDSGRGQTSGPVGWTESPGEEPRVSQLIFDKPEGKADAIRATAEMEPPPTLTVLGKRTQNES